MISEEILRSIADLFNGDTEEEFFKYKSGPQLVDFFNTNFGYEDSYGQGFPSRWYFTVDKLVDLINKKKIDRFFSLILSKRYLMVEKRISEVNAVVSSERIHQKMNNLLKPNGLVIIKKEDRFELVSEDEDLVYVGEGGFATVYRRRSNGLIVKKLKEEFIVKQDIKSRFKREYNITKSLNDIPGIIEVYDFDLDDYSYTMKFAEQSLFDYFSNYSHEFDTQKTMIRQILFVMGKVHERNIVHRDISPHNILIVNGRLHISDFGLGKDLDMFHSHRTAYTNSFGQLFYCAPEQFMQLKEGDKKSDVYSLGRLINYIVGSDPRNYKHLLRSVTEKATNENALYRFEDAKELLEAVEKTISYHENNEKIQEVKEKIKNGYYDEDVENYIYGLSSMDLCKDLDNVPQFIISIMKFIENSDKRSLEIMKMIEDSFREYCGFSYPSYDVFSDLAYRILKSNGFSYLTKETAARILNTIATDVNRFESQRLIERLIEGGLEPSIEDILSV
ncbi:MULTISPECIES: protein kinase [unclassified Oceanobacillus]|uniref:protein kinase domain-containing protein n=1 Tax=unclassified Oceanobacillus TaxID=2630292 RepID=UPI001BE96B3A|nr:MULTISPECIES: protein kinase [unclassified Oceanobacillus]MBT2600020.1 protein kinase [Oceanobacillus sp. ISL-74]MBT2652532.1 protein kinase [Oceanobacillus sp. ISL-73]